MTGDDVPVEPAELVDLVQQCCQEPHVGIGTDLHGVAHTAIGRLDASWVHEHDAGTACARSSQLTEHVGDRVEAGLRRSRVLADDDAQVGLVEVGDRVHVRRPEHGLAGDELVGTVLCARRERPTDAERSEQGADVQRAQRVECHGVTDVRGHGLLAVLGDHCSEPGGRERHRLVPRCSGPAAIGGAHARVVETVGVSMHVDRCEALVTREPEGDGVGAVSGEPDQLPVRDVGHEAARRFADATEGMHLVGVRHACHTCHARHVGSVGPTLRCERVER